MESFLFILFLHIAFYHDIHMISLKKMGYDLWLVNLPLHFTNVPRTPEASTPPIWRRMPNSRSGKIEKRGVGNVVVVVVVVVVEVENDWSFHILRIVWFR